MASRHLVARTLPAIARRSTASSLAISRTMPVPQAGARRLHAISKHLAPAGTTTAASTATDFVKHHEPVTQTIDTANFIDNQFQQSKTTSWIEVHDPATNSLVTRTPHSTEAELRAATDSAAKAFPGWKATSLLTRQQIMFKYVALIREHWDRLAASITMEQGKTFADAKGDVLRGLQVAEVACGITTQLTGDVLEVAKDMETRNYKEPLGVVAAICPFSKKV
jgi:malonate-semialdehyde dehydrogenase (acetylating) / methylmalonate-semialdehyde dehydrogenase